MSANGSFLQLIAEASFVVQLVMLILVLASIVSWTFIFQKRKDLKEVLSVADVFDSRFWSGIDLADLYRQLTASHYRSQGVENIFIAGYREFARLRQQSAIDAATLVDGSQRAMRIAFTRELDRLDERLPFLATVGSTSPYVGLFGTVWGIMNSFRALGNVQQATLAMVAPGISEALVATAMGLFAAIPAVVAYNRFATRTERLSTRYEIFMEEFVSLLHRQAKPAIK
ncbi:MAG: protein TolQ [Gammaproteobacteria bacterium]